MRTKDSLGDRFEAHRSHLRGVALRMLGSASEAEDAVQEAWIRLNRAGADEVDNLRAWLTTVVARVSLDMLRTRAARREAPSSPDLPDSVVSHSERGDPEHEALLADSVGPALLVVLETLAPAERLAFVLHDVFAVPFDEIGAILDRSPNAAKQLASRARRKVRGPTAVTDADPMRERAIVKAFLAAARGGDFDGLVALLAPDVALRADVAAVRMGASAEVRGASAVAESFAGRARAAQAALVDGIPGAVWSRGGVPQVLFRFAIAAETISAIELLADPELLESLDVVVLEA